MSYLVFGAVHINYATAPTTKDEFYSKFIGKVPDIAEAWKVVSQEQKKNNVIVEKPIKKRRKKNGKAD
jgi:hypothetical protein